MSRCYDVTFKRFKGTGKVKEHVERIYAGTRDAAEQYARNWCRHKLKRLFDIDMFMTTSVEFVPEDQR